MDKCSLLSNKLVEIIEKMYLEKSTGKYTFSRFNIKKSNGKLREIVAPCSLYKSHSRVLLAILELLLPKYVVKRNRLSVAFVYKYMNKANVSSRLKSTDCAAIKLDIKSAFQSTNKFILFNNLNSYFSEILNIELIQKLIEVITLDGVLEQGLPTSRLMFEMCAKRIDENIKGELRNKNLYASYIRYVDDIIIIVKNKNNKNLKSIVKKLTKKVHKEIGYSFNQDKTKIITKKNKEVWFLSSCLYHPNDFIKKDTRKIRISGKVRRKYRSYLYLGKEKNNKQSLAIAGSFKQLI